MRSVLVSSTELYAGKSALCLALAMKLKENGLRVGYMKPVGNLIVDLDGVLVDDDAATMKKMLGLKRAWTSCRPSCSPTSCSRTCSRARTSSSRRSSRRPSGR